MARIFAEHKLFNCFKYICTYIANQLNDKYIHAYLTCQLSDYFFIYQPIFFTDSWKLDLASFNATLAHWLAILWSHKNWIGHTLRHITPVPGMAAGNLV